VQAKLVKERDTLAVTAKKLSRNLAKVRVFCIFLAPILAGFM
jgi:hypothetical protein